MATKCVNCNLDDLDYREPRHGIVKTGVWTQDTVTNGLGERFMAQFLSSSDSHRRTRRDHASETAEDYVEAIAEITRGQGQCRIADLARKFGVTHVTVLKIVSRLDASGLVRTEAYRPIELTARGTRLAAKCRERHETVYDFLLALGVEAKIAAIDAEGIEHHVSPNTLTQFRKFLKSQKPGIPNKAKK